MRFVIAIVLFVTAFVTIGLGIAQRTILAGPPSFTTEVTTGSAPITVVDGAVLNALPGTQTISLTGQGDVFLAYGRTTDVLGWVGDLPYNHLTFNTETLGIDTETVAGGATDGSDPASTDPADPADPTDAATPAQDTTDAAAAVPFSGEVPDPHGSDLWVQEFDGTDQLVRKINAPHDISLIILSNGVDPAPAEVSIEWPLDTSAPFAGPLIIAGILSMLLGLAAFLWALVHARRRRGPRRKQPRLPKTPQPKRLKRAKQRPALPAAATVYPIPETAPSPTGPTTTGPFPAGPAPTGPSSTGPFPTGPTTTGPSPTGPSPYGGGIAGGFTQRRRWRPAFAASGILIASLALTGCTAGSGVLGSGLEPAPTASADIADINDLKPPAVTKQQLARIVTSLTDTVTQADTDKNDALAASRLGGPALEARLASYKILKKDKSLAPIGAIPAGETRIVLPQQNDEWPRSVFTVIVPTDTTVAPVALMLVQASPRENYKAHYLITLEPGLSVPPVAPPQIGSATQNPDNNLGLLAPSALAQAYGDILTQGESAANFASFDAESDSLRVDIGFDAKQKRKKALLPKKGKIEFSNAPNVEEPISFPTNDNGQIVAVALNDTEKVTPTEAGAAITPPDLVKALSGVRRSTKGVFATYGVQLLFYVPPVSDTTAKIQLLGFSSNLIAAKEVN